MSDRMDIREVVAWRVRERRRELGLTQKELGATIGWSEANLSAAERSQTGGRLRSWTVEELVVFATALMTTVPYLLTPPPGVDVELPEGVIFEPVILGDLRTYHDAVAREVEDAASAADAAAKAYDEASERYERAQLRAKAAP